MTFFVHPVSTRRALQYGFSLIELAVVLVVVGFVMGGAMFAATPFLERARIDGTQKRLEKIADALSRYAQNYFTLPCPANPNPSGEPFGTPMGSGAAGTNMTVKCGTTPLGHNGIVPFAVLGLNEDDVRDAYGNYITYAVSPVLDAHNYRDDYSAATTVSTPVHNQCTSTAWRRTRLVTRNIASYWTTGHYAQPAWLLAWAAHYMSPNESGEVIAGINRPIYKRNKARLCCPAYDASLFTAYGENLLNVYEDNTFTGIHARPYFARHADLKYGNALAANNRDWADDSDIDVVNPDSAIEYVAFVLVSHGKNGDGAFMRDGGQRPRTTTAATTTESSNWNTRPTLSFVSRPHSLEQDANYFDDIVLWRTNRQLISANGTDSCSTP